MRHKISTVVYAQGFIEDFIESETELVKIDSAWSNEAQQDALEQNEYKLQVAATWKVLNDGLDELRREHTSLQNKLALIQQAINTPT